MNIIIKPLLLPTLNALALANTLTPEEYASNIVSSFLEGQYRGSILDKIKLEPVENLKTLKDEKISDLTKKIK